MSVTAPARAVATVAMPLEVTYLVPLRTGPDESVCDLAAYLQGLAPHVAEVLVVDGSLPEVVRAHRAAFGPGVRVVEPRIVTPMGKVGNVLTGLREAACEAVVIADDDVRYEPAQVATVLTHLDGGEVVRPQNHFAPLPWHARFDTARTLLNRVTGGDWPGTLAVRRSFLLGLGGYAGDVMFENLELVRTVQAGGGREVVALDLLVRRVPPSAAHFRGQQVRQAYDELARPARLAASLAVLPLTVATALRGHRALLAGAAVAATAAAELGRRRAGGRGVYPASSVLLAPPWLLWRSLCSWAALAARVRGGVAYRGRRIRRAATSSRVLRARVLTAGTGS